MSETPGADTLELERELRDGLAGVTPTWPTDLMRYEQGGGRLAILRDGERTLVADFYHEADREHYVRCSPDNILRLLDALASLRAEKEELRRERDEARVEIERLRDCLRKDPMVLLIAHEDGDHERLSRATAKAIDRAEAAESLLAEAGKALELARSTFAMLVGKDQITGTSLMAAYASCIEAASAARVVATRIASLTKEP